MASHPPCKAPHRALRGAFLLALAIACNSLTGAPDLTFSTEASNLPSPAAEPSLPDAAPAVPCPPGESDCPIDDYPIVPPPDYSACQSDTECAPHLCLSGACTRECQTDGECDGAGARCVQDAASGRSGCARNCDLLEANGPRAGLQECGSGMRCNFVSDGERAGYTACALAAQSGIEGTACLTEADCLTDLSCFAGRCARACDPDAPACPERQVCSGVVERAGQQTGNCCSIPDGQACNVVTNCGCGQEQACQVVDASGKAQCRPVSSPVGPYASCAQGPCPALHMCVDGVCQRYCDPERGCGTEGVACTPVATYEGVPFEASPPSFCRRGCDLLSPLEPAAGLRACGAGATCSYDTELNVAGCRRAGTGEQATACDTTSDCGPGFACLFQQCRRWCEPAGDDCSAGETCSNVRARAGRDLGLCCQPPAGSECDWATDCGCGAGRTCSSNGDGVFSCRVVQQPPLRPGDPCTNDTQCSVGYTCLGTCVDRCRISSDCVQEGASCILFSEADYGFCASNCDAVSPQAPQPGWQSCAAGFGCFFFTRTPDGTAASYCYPTGSGAAGSGCEDSFDCSPGLRCSQGTCRQTCDLELDNCPNDGECVTEPPLPVVGGRNLGICVPD